MRTAVVLLLLAGCASPCTPLRDEATVQEVQGTSIRVQLADGEPAVLHLARTEILGADCQSLSVADLRAGTRVTFQVDQWAESYPVQGWPERIVVRS